MRLKHRNQPLKYTLSHGLLQITIGIDALALALEGGPAFVSGTRITNNQALAKAILQALQHEEEDGTQPIHRVLDAAYDKVAEYGTSIDPDEFMVTEAA